MDLLENTTNYFLENRCKKSFHQMEGDVGMHNAKNHGNNKSSYQDDSTIMCNPSLHHSGLRVTQDCTIILL